MPLLLIDPRMDQRSADATDGLADRRSDGRHETVVVNVFFLINEVFGRKLVKSVLHLRRDYEPFDNRLSGITRRL